MYIVWSVMTANEWCRQHCIMTAVSFLYRIWSQWCASEIISQLQDQLSAEMELNSLASTLVSLSYVYSGI